MQLEYSKLKGINPGSKARILYDFNDFDVARVHKNNSQWFRFKSTTRLSWIRVTTTKSSLFKYF